MAKDIEREEITVALCRIAMEAKEAVLARHDMSDPTASSTR